MCLMGFFQADLFRDQVCSPEIQCSVLLFAKLPSLWTLNSTFSWSLQPSLSPVSTFPTSSSFFVSRRFRRAPFLVDSLITYARKLLMLHSRFHGHWTLVYFYFYVLLLNECMQTSSKIPLTKIILINMVASFFFLLHLNSLNIFSKLLVIYLLYLFKSSTVVTENYSGLEWKISSCSFFKLQMFR